MPRSYFFYGATRNGWAPTRGRGFEHSRPRRGGLSSRCRRSAVMAQRAADSASARCAPRRYLSLVRPAGPLRGSGIGRTRGRGVADAMARGVGSAQRDHPHVAGGHRGTYRSIPRPCRPGPQRAHVSLNRLMAPNQSGRTNVNVATRPTQAGPYDRKQHEQVCASDALQTK